MSIHFGAIESLCVFDEGVRIESYNNKKTLEITKYQLNKFYGNPIFVSTSDDEFMQWLRKESCGFSDSLTHYLIITINDFVDIASAFPPEVIVDVLK